MTTVAMSAGGGTYDKAGLTNFTRVRLDLSTMSIVTDDYQFASQSGMPVPYGVAGDCYSASVQNCRKGQLKIDLRGTSFTIKVGNYADITAVKSLFGCSRHERGSEANLFAPRNSKSVIFLEEAPSVVSIEFL